MIFLHGKLLVLKNTPIHKNENTMRTTGPAFHKKNHLIIINGL
jgi:hypothetical protein